MVFLEVRAAGAPPQKPKPAPKAAAKPLVGGERAILKALRQPISIEVKETPLQDVVDFLQQNYGIPIVLDRKELEGLSIDPSKTLVTRKLTGISLRSVLDLVLGELGLKWTIHREVLLITSPTRAESEEFLITTVYDISDLVMPVPDRSYHGSLPGSGPPDASSMQFQGGLPPQGMGGPPPQVRVANPNDSAADFSGLIDLITQTMEPKSWEANGGQGTIALFPANLSLVIRQTREVHLEISALLAKLRARSQAMPTVVVDLHWIWLETPAYQRLVGGGATAAGRVPAAVDVELLDQVARKAPGFRARITCSNAQGVHIASGDRRSLVMGAIPVVGLNDAGSHTFGPDAAAIAFRPVGNAGGTFAPTAPPPGAVATRPPRYLAQISTTAPAPASGQIQPGPVGAPAPHGPITAAGNQVGYMPVTLVPNVGVIVQVCPVVAPGGGTAVLDVQSFITRWSEPSPQAQVGGAGSASCPIDRPNMPAAEMAMTARVPLGKPVLLGAVTFAPAGGAGLDRATENPVQLCLIATTSIAADAGKPAKKK
jgi:hypothetical protein